MKNHIFSFVLSIALLFFFTNALSFAQNRPTRFSEQHNSKNIKDNLKNIEKMLMQHMQNDSSNIRLSAVQTFREIEQLFPTKSFNSFIIPLKDIVENEELDVQLRITAAIALDELHSDIGDQAIYEMASNSANESVKNVCVAISFEKAKIADKALYK
jgi:hypothetical protein